MRLLELTLAFNNVTLIQWSLSGNLAVSRLFDPFKRALSALVGWRLRGVRIVVGLVWGFRGWEFLHDVLKGSVHFDWRGGGRDGGVLLTTWLAQLSLIHRLYNILLVLPLLLSDLVPFVPQASTSVILLFTGWSHLILELRFALLTRFHRCLFHRFGSEVK